MDLKDGIMDKDIEREMINKIIENRITPGMLDPDKFSSDKLEVTVIPVDEEPYSKIITIP